MVVKHTSRLMMAAPWIPLICSLYSAIANESFPPQAYCLVLKYIMASTPGTPVKRKRPPADPPTPPSTPEESPLLFIGRPCCPPFVFTTEGRLSNTNIEWLKTADLDELDYLKEKAEEAIWFRSGGKRRREEAILMGEKEIVEMTVSDDETILPSNHSNQVAGFAGWTKAQEKAFWHGQVSTLLSARPTLIRLYE